MRRALADEGTTTQSDLVSIIEIQQEVALSTLPMKDLMTLICERTQTITKAAGAVIEIVDGDDLVYAAASGTMGKYVGFRINSQGSMSGLAVRTKEVLHCRDSETDSRVDRVATRAVGARSMICVPLQQKDSPAGVLKVVHGEANRFGDAEVAALRLMANLLAARLAHAAASATAESALASLRENERKFRTLFESAMNGFILSSEGILLEANQAACELFGYSPAEFRGRDLMDLVVPNEREVQRQHVRNAAVGSREVTCRRKDGSFFTADAIGRTIEMAGLTLRLSTFTDITEKKRAEQALRESAEKSREAAAQKASFLANMSHEIRTPLNGVVGMLQLLEDTGLNEKQTEFARIAKQSADTLLTLVNDILDFSKLEAGKIQLENIAFDLHGLVLDLHKVLLPNAQAKSIQFKCDIDATTPKGVQGDPTRLRQVLTNLTVNALKFTEQGGVRVRIASREGLIRFEVHDSGIGLDELAMARLFQPFTQGDISTTRNYGGTGLGLSICKQLVEQMQGRIGAESAGASRGSCFWFEVPLTAVPNFRPADRPVAHHYEGTALRVLVVEDNAVNRMIATASLKKMGHAVETAENGKLALDAQGRTPFDLILMDCQMPVLDGFETTRELRRRGDLTPVIAMTANAMQGDRERCLEAGMNDYIAKPMEFVALVEVITRVVDRARRS